MKQPTPEIVWEPPTPLGTLPTVSPFPVHVFPPSLQRFVAEGAIALNCPPDYLALPMLAVAGGCIANSRWLRITRTHQQSPAIYGCVVGSKGSGKSPALKLVRAPLDHFQRIYAAEWKRAWDAWEALDEGDRGAPPILRRVICGDITTETLSILLDDNPRGLTKVRDELAGMLASMNQYKAGAGHDRQFYLELWSHTLSPRDRKSDKRPPAFFNRPLVSIIGGTQPDVVERFRGESRRGTPPPDDGFVDRWLFAFPEEMPAKGETWQEVSPEATDAWAACVRDLLALEMGGEDGVLEPRFVSLDADAAAEWESFTHALAVDVNSPDLPDFLGGVFAKLRGYCGRLALVVHLLRQVCGEPVNDDLDAESMRRAVTLVHYFAQNARKVYSVMDFDTRLKGAKRILTWIDREKRSLFKRWELHKDLESERLFPTPESLDRPLELLESHNIIRILTPEHTGRAGRPPAGAYAVNPHWLNRVNRENRENAAARS